MIDSYELRPADAVLLSRDEARALTDEVKQDAQALWQKLVQLYNGEAHKALGFRSWRAYCAAEFQMTRDVAYQMLNAGKVMDELHSGRRGESSAMADKPLPATERVARALVPVMNGGHSVSETWDRVLDEHGPEPTAAQVRQTVNGHGPIIELPRATQAMTVLADALQETAKRPDIAVEFGFVAMALDVWDEVHTALKALGGQS